MPNFATPESIAVIIELGAANVRIVASDRTDTVVDVRPTDPANESDVQAAQQVRADYAYGTLRVTGTKVRFYDFSRKTRSVDVTIELPTGSRVSAEVLAGRLGCTGRLGESRLRTSIGDVALDRTGPLRLHTGFGHVTAGGIGGDAEISTGSGRIRIGAVEGAVRVKNSNGDTAIDAAGGDVRVRNSNGSIDVERAGAGVDVQTSHGTIRLGEVVRGPVVAGTAAGNLDIGIAAGTAAWLEVNTGFGRVRNEMQHTTAPGESDATVQVRGRTGFGDILIHRS